MPTHETKCVVCESPVYCCDDVHALSIGGPEGHGGCEKPPFIEFCSVKCFEDLEKRMVSAKQNFKECWGYWGDR